MKNKMSWNEKYILVLNDYLSIKDIMNLFDIGQPRATKLRNEAIDYASHNDLDVFGKLVPTEAILTISGKDKEYFKEKMYLEMEALECQARINRIYQQNNVATYVA